MYSPSVVSTNKSFQSSPSFKSTHANAIEDRLFSACVALKRRERHIRITCFCIGTLMFFCGAPTGWLCFFKLIPGSFCLLGAGTYWSFAICFAVWLLAFSPAHMTWMPRTILFIVVFLFVVIILFVIACIEFKRTNCSLHGFSGTACNFWALWPAVAIIPLAASCCTMAYAVRWNSHGYVMSGREMLATFWIGIRIFYFGNGIVILVFVTMIATVDEVFAASHEFRGYVACCLIWISTSSLLKTSNRQRIQMFIGWFGKDGGLAAAATIASAIGSFGVETTLAMSVKSFRGISVTSLSASDFASNEDSGLYLHTAPAMLGSVDAFISHSWSDPCDLKWEALQRWRRSFVRKNGREPVIWLDKACINQKDIARSLACLPVFLAGCETFVVLYGPTYTQRLWCCMELFIFLRMGGSSEKIRIFPIGEGCTISDFDALNARCFDDKDRQQLLGIIETGFGSVPAFNQEVRISWNLSVGKNTVEFLAPTSDIGDQVEQAHPSLNTDISAVIAGLDDETHRKPMGAEQVELNIQPKLMDVGCKDVLEEIQEIEEIKKDPKHTLDDPITAVNKDNKAWCEASERTVHKFSL